MADQQNTAWQMGDVVRFIIGGPPMVVTGAIPLTADARDMIVCQWFGTDNSAQRSEFPAKLLVRVTDLPQ